MSEPDIRLKFGSRAQKRWSAEENHMLRNLWWRGESKERISVLMRRPVNGVVEQATVLKAKRGPEYIAMLRAKEAERQTRRFEKMRTYWQPIFVQALTTLQAQEPRTAVEMADALNSLHVFTPTGAEWTVQTLQKWMSRLRGEGLPADFRLVPAGTAPKFVDDDRPLLAPWPDDAPHYTDIDQTTLRRERYRSPGLIIGLSRAPNPYARAI